MKKFLLATAALAVMTGSAFAADLGARPYVKAPAPAPAPVANWTGFYVFGGAGGGLWAADSNLVTNADNAPGPVGLVINRDRRLGGSGWFGTAGLGYDWQLASRWVVGVFADGQWGDISGSIDTGFGAEGRERLRNSYAAGARVGYLVAPNVLSYVNAGYSRSEWSGSTWTDIRTQFPSTEAMATGSFNRNGWFIGGGVENNFDIFGIAAPGWFMKTEYRGAYYDRAELPITDCVSGCGAVAPFPAGVSVTFKPWVQTISTSLVYRFNWTGSAVSGY